MPVLNSTKNLEIIEPPTATKEGVGVFEYTDNYTVFHYGRMPDLIPGKGEAICRMAVFNFIEAGGGGRANPFPPVHRPQPDRVRPRARPGPGRRALAPDAGNYLVPVQVLFRNELPQGSSVTAGSQPAR